MTDNQPTTTNTTNPRKIVEVRFYNGALWFDSDVIYQVNFNTTETEFGIRNTVEITGGIRDDGKPNHWSESSKKWLRKWFPQIVKDIKDDPIVGWKL
jgi:hypothetical protein